MDDQNFDKQARSRFAAFTDDGGTWTWTGLAAAFAARYNRADIEELIVALDLELEDMPE